VILVKLDYSRSSFPVLTQNFINLLAHLAMLIQVLYLQAMFSHPRLKALVDRQADAIRPPVINRARDFQRFTVGFLDDHRVFHVSYRA
jgi:hypothetical protein